MITANPQYEGLSFFPDGYLARRAQRRANRLCGSLLIVALVGVGTAYAFADRSLAHVRADYVEISAAFDREAGRLNRLSAMQKDEHMLEHRAQLAESLIERTPRAAVLTELRSLLPDDASLVDLSLSSRVRPPAPKTPEQVLAEKRGVANAVLPIEPKTYDVSLRIGGIAFTDVQVAQYINRLARSRYFDDVNLSYSRDLLVAGQPMRRFEVNLVVRPQPLPQSKTDAASDNTVAATEATPLR